MEKIDIKHIKVPNICFSLTDDDDEREVEYSKQRIERGFDDSELWSLTDTICNFIVPRLEAFKNTSGGYSGNLTPTEWNNILDKMLIAFKLTARDEGSRMFTKKEEEQIDEGLDLFREWFFSLWW